MHTLKKKKEREREREKKKEKKRKRIQKSRVQLQDWLGTNKATCLETA